MTRFLRNNALTRLALRSVAVAIIVITPVFNATSAAADPTLPGRKAPVATQVSFNRHESVLEKLRSFTGEKNRSTLTHLFRSTDGAFAQDPPVLLSDGTARARVTVRAPTQGEQAPSFMVSGGACVDVRMKDNNVWELDIVPARGSSATSVTILSEKSMVEYPLVVSPPRDIFDPKQADPAFIEYVTIANELAASPERR